MNRSIRCSRCVFLVLFLCFEEALGQGYPPEEAAGRMTVAAEAAEETLQACARLMATAPGEPDRRMLIAALDEGLGGGQLERVREACRRIKKKGWVAQSFVVGRVFEQENVDWIRLCLKTASSP